jgi:hypothetical protein
MKDQTLKGASSLEELPLGFFVKLELNIYALGQRLQASKRTK